MNAWLTATWFGVLAPLIIGGMTGGPAGPWGHAAFHVGYIACTIAALVCLSRFRQASSSRSVRAVAVGLACAQVVLIAGQIGELMVVLSHSGAHAGEDALLDPAHDIPALALSAPGLLFSLLGIIVLTVVVLSSRRSASSLVV